MSNAELIFDGKHGTGESPVWVPEKKALYWVDIPRETSGVGALKSLISRFEVLPFVLAV